jgi:ATP-binding cassette subfamily F protein 3
MVGKSMVNKEKLRKAEAKLAEKREKRGDNELYQPQIPKWDPNVKPAIIVNQQRQSFPTESRSKDLKLDNFDISYAGKVILKDASLGLNYGRKYGLVGKNGVGKSTLLRAIANGELQVPSNLRILHVEQEIYGDDTPALVSVLQADTERESLLKEERELNEKLKNSQLTSEESNIISSRLKEVYQILEDIEADKAESRYISPLISFSVHPPFLQV